MFPVYRIFSLATVYEYPSGDPSKDLDLFSITVISLVQPHFNAYMQWVSPSVIISSMDEHEFTSRVHKSDGG